MTRRVEIETGDAFFLLACYGRCHFCGHPNTSFMVWEGDAMVELGGCCSNAECLRRYHERTPQ